MSEQQETPVWHSIVGDGYEPVQIGEEAKRDDEVLKAQGWVATGDGGKFIYQPDMMPRRRRKKVFFGVAITGTRDGLPFERNYTIKPGERISVSDDGLLVFLGKPQAEGQVER